MKMNFFKDGKLSGKGTAAVICFCLAAVAALGIFSYNRSANELKTELSGLTDNRAQTTVIGETSPAADADAPAEVPFTEADAPQEHIILEHDAFGGAEQTSETEAAEPSAPSDEEAAAPPAEAADAKLTDAVVRPVNGEVLNTFSGGELVKSKTLNVWKTHDGIDVAADTGSAVKSMTSGTVRDVNVDPLMGVTVVIDHGSGYEGYYCNLAADVEVSEGDNVNAGTVIGTVGSTAEAEISEEAHLHFGLKKNGSWTDPADVLSAVGS